MTSEPDYGQLCPHLGWLPIDAIKKMFERTTQLACMPMSTILKKWYKSPNPALNVHPRDEPVATDTIYSNTLAIDCGITSAQVLRPILQMCILSSPINSLSIRFWTTSPNAVHLPNSSATAHRLRLVNVSSRFFDPYTFPLGRVSHISSIRTLPNVSTRTSNDCATHYPWPLWGSGVHLASLPHVCVFLAQQQGKKQNYYRCWFIALLCYHTPPCKRNHTSCDARTVVLSLDLHFDPNTPRLWWGMHLGGILSTSELLQSVGNAGYLSLIWIVFPWNLHRFVSRILR
jgi:hypothetical protein